MILHLAAAALLNLAVTRVAAAPSDFSDSGQVQPYIESLKKKYDLKPTPKVEDLPPAPEKPQTVPTTPSDSGSVEPYVEKLREKNGIQPPSPGPAKNLSSPGEVQPYLETVKKDHELAPKFKGRVSNAAGFSFVATNTFHLSSDNAQANAFEAVYSPDTKYSPSADLFYEKQLYRNPYAGSFGIVGHFNPITIKGHGVFTKSGAQSPDTEFRFLAFPVSVGGSYRFLTLRYLVPFIQMSAVGVPFVEMRNDNKPNRRGWSRGYNMTGGLNLSLDWISRSDAWEQYDMQGILHTYLTVQLESIRTLSGDVTFNYNGMYAGLTFEF